METPLGHLNDFLEVQRELFLSFTPSREPSAFEQATARAIWAAALQSTASDGSTRGKLICVSAATGAGKSVSAIALMAYLYRQGKTAALVIPELSLIEEAYAMLLRLVPSIAVAMWSSIHKVDASRAVLWDYEKGHNLVPSKQFTLEQFKAAPLILTTHDRWRAEASSGRHYGVRKQGSDPRSLVMLDEELDEELVYWFNSEDVSALASCISGAVLNDEGRAHGFVDIHPAVSALRSIQRKAEEVKDTTKRPYQLIAPVDLVTADEVDRLNALTRDDLELRLAHVSEAGRAAQVFKHEETLSALKAASQGRVFYSTSNGGGFYAWQHSMPPEGNTLCLDGTADLNGFYAITPWVHVVEGPAPNYAPLKLTHVRPPQELRGKFKPGSGGLLLNRWAAGPMWNWLQQFILDHTRPGDKALVYTRKDFLNYGWEGTQCADHPLWGGREIHFVNFGRGRGSNRWKDCNVYFRVGDFYPVKAQLLAKMGSVAGDHYTPERLSSLSSGKTKDPRYALCRDAWLNVHNKQDMARTAIRNFDSSGVPLPVRAYLIDTDYSALIRHKAKMFPGARGIELIGHAPEDEASGPKRLARLLSRTEATVLSSKAIKDATGVTSQNINRELEVPAVAEALAARGWRKGTLKEAGMKGKGYALIRELLLIEGALSSIRSDSNDTGGNELLHIEGAFSSIRSDSQGASIAAL